MVLFIV